jgi:hypothetical protein
MGKNLFSEAAATKLRALLRTRPGYEHLEVESRGEHLLLFVREVGEVVRLARLTALPRREYGLSIRWHDDRWQRMPIVGPMETVVEDLMAEFAEFLRSPST